MKIFCVLGNDASNYSCNNVIRKLMQHHDVKIFTNNLTEQANAIFEDIKEKIKPLSQATKKDIEWADCAFCSVMSMQYMVTFPKYVFCYAHMNPNIDEVRGSDFVFEIASNTKGMDYGVPHTFASMPVGLAKNDSFIERQQSKKQILYIDAGHFPFGINGKKQIAEMLIKICLNFPDYTVCIRPRWKQDALKEDMSNPNYYHIYDAILDVCSGSDLLPKNLEMPTDFFDLQRQIDESECIISSCTSAYLDVALRGKPVLLIKGIENEDSYHLRNAYFEHLYEFAENSGCVVDYKAILEYLPAGRMCNPQHIREAFAYTDGATERIVDAIEFIYERFISRGFYPDIKEYKYETFKDTMQASEKLSFEDLLCYRLFCATETCIALTYKISTVIDWKEYFQQQLMNCRETAKILNDRLLCDDLETAKKIVKEQRKHLTSLKQNYIIKNKNMLVNDVDLAYLYSAIFEQRGGSAIIDAIEIGSNLHEVVCYYAGLEYFKLGKKETAYHYLTMFAEKCQTHATYYKYNISANSINAFEKLINYLYKKGKYAQLYNCLAFILSFFSHDLTKLNKIKRIILKSGCKKFVMHKIIGEYYGNALCRNCESDIVQKLNSPKTKYYYLSLKNFIVKKK